MRCNTLCFDETWCCQKHKASKVHPSKVDDSPIKIMISLRFKPWTECLCCIVILKTLHPWSSKLDKPCHNKAGQVQEEVSLNHDQSRGRIDHVTYYPFVNVFMFSFLSAAVKVVWILHRFTQIFYFFFFCFLRICWSVTNFIPLLTSKAFGALYDFIILRHILRNFNLILALFVILLHFVQSPIQTALSLRQLRVILLDFCLITRAHIINKLQLNFSNFGSLNPSHVTSMHGLYPCNLIDFMLIVVHSEILDVYFCAIAVFLLHNKLWISLDVHLHFFISI